MGLSLNTCLAVCGQRARAILFCGLHASSAPDKLSSTLRLATAALLEAGLPLAADVPDAIAAAMLDLTPGARAMHPALLRDHLRAAAWRPCGRRSFPGPRLVGNAMSQPYRAGCRPY